MASWFFNLFAQSPFLPLIDHQRKISEGVALVPDLVDAALEEDQARVRELAKALSQIEAEADTLKTRLRDALPQSRFMQVSRPVLLDILSIQDHIADGCEDIGVLFTMRRMERLPKDVAEILRELVQQAVVVVERAGKVVEALETLSNVSFSGPEAQRVLAMIDLVGNEEHEADKIQDRLCKVFFLHEDELKPAAIFLWMKIFYNIGDLANQAEKVMHRIRLFMAK